jgi:aryl-alcohol dehydrogenase-like predicted oxidoreductase
VNRNKVGELEISVVGIGGNNFGTDFFGTGCDARTVDHIVGTALDNGINLFDTAEEYSITSFLGAGRSEELLGAALRGRRDEAVIATKYSNFDEADPGQAGADRIVAAAEASLKRLGTDRIDLFQQHQPDEQTPIDEILEALDRLVVAGKVREVGTCNLDEAQLARARSAGLRLNVRPFATCQLQFSVLERPPPEVLDAVQRTSTKVLAYFPLASGLLTGKYRKGQAPPTDTRLGAGGVVSQMLRDGLMARRPPLSDDRLSTVEELTELAASCGHSLLDLAISWLVCQPTVGAVLTGVTSPTQVEANAAAAAWNIDAATLDAIDAIVDAETEDA